VLNCPVRVSKAFYLSMPILAIIFGVFLVFASGVRIPPRSPRDQGDFFLVLLAPTLLNAVVSLTLIYKAWTAIQDGYARTTPGKAIGLLFIPLFNIYWLFQAIWGFAKDYNQFIERHRIEAKKLDQSLFLSYPILLILSFLPIPCLPLALMVSYFLVIAKTCDAINALAATEAHNSLRVTPDGSLAYKAASIKATKIPTKDPNEISCDKCKFVQWTGYEICQKCGAEFN